MASKDPREKTEFVCPEASEFFGKHSWMRTDYKILVLLKTLAAELRGGGGLEMVSLLDLLMVRYSRRVHEADFTSPALRGTNQSESTDAIPGRVRGPPHTQTHLCALLEQLTSGRKMVRS